MKRRSFFGALLGAAAVPLVKKAAAEPEPEPEPKIQAPAADAPRLIIGVTGFAFVASGLDFWPGMPRDPRRGGF